MDWTRREREWQGKKLIDQDQDLRRGRKRRNRGGGGEEISIRLVSWLGGLVSWLVG